MLSAGSGAALLVMVLSDWPSSRLNLFWAEHSVLGAVLSTLLLAGVGYLAFEAGEVSRQAALDQSVTVVGMSGLVDRLIDVEIALGLLAHPQPPGYENESGRPLAWMRGIRNSLAKQTSDLQVPLQPLAAIDWRLNLVNESVRRIIGGMRDWSALVGMSSEGREVLQRMGAVRIELLSIRQRIENGRGIDDLAHFRVYLRMLAVILEYESAPDYPRPAVVGYVDQQEKERIHDSPFDALIREPVLTVRRALELIDRQYELCNAGRGSHNTQRESIVEVRAARVER
jgi:hypothetical protein